MTEDEAASAADVEQGSRNLLMRVIAASVLGVVIGKAFETMGQPERSVVRGVIAVALVLAAYKFIIVKLGERPRDDLPGKDALKNLGLGLLIGFGLMAAAVGFAAIAGVYTIVGKGDASQFILVVGMIVLTVGAAFLAYTAK